MINGMEKKKHRKKKTNPTLHKVYLPPFCFRRRYGKSLIKTTLKKNLLGINKGSAKRVENVHTYIYTFISYSVRFVGHLHEVSLRQVDAERFPGEERARDPAEHDGDEGVLGHDSPEDARVQLAGVGRRCFLSTKKKKVGRGCKTWLQDRPRCTETWLYIYMRLAVEKNLESGVTQLVERRSALRPAQMV